MLLYTWRIECPCLWVGLEQLNLNTDGLYLPSYFAYLFHIIVTPTITIKNIRQKILLICGFYGKIMHVVPF